MANKIHAALSASFCRISAGTLPPAASGSHDAALLAVQEEWQTAPHQALCHWRGTIEPLVLNGTLEPLVAADLDLVNMFGNAE